MSAQAATQTGEVQGTVVDPAGRTIPGSRVFISQALPATAPKFVAPPVVTGPYVTAVAVSAAGVFRVTALPPGDYIACAETTTPGFLDPCHWSKVAPRFTITAGNATTNIVITLAKGSIIPIHVEDPQKLLKPVAGKLDAELQFYVTSAGGTRHAVAILNDQPGARNHFVTVPYGTSVTVHTFSPRLVIHDENSATPAQAGKAVSVSDTGDAPTLNFSVAGPKP